MNSTLLHPPSTELQLLTWSRQLQTVRFNEYTALGYLSNAMHKMRSAQSSDYSPARRLRVSYDGIFSVLLGTLYLHGLRPGGKEGYQALVVQLGGEMLQLKPFEREQIMLASQFMQLVTSDNAHSVEPSVSYGVLALGHRSLAQAQKVYPDWFL